MTTETAAKRDTQKLQRAIVDGLEDVKAQDIQVFDTEHLSPLFERVIVASGTSNRQTKALAASVVDAVREAGFAKPRVEGQANGEWIIVDCAQAVVHIMQPAFRTYYHLEELWGEKPVRLKLGSAKPVVVVAKAPVQDTKVSARAKAVAAAKKNYAGKAPVRRTTEALAGAAPSAPARASRGSSAKASPSKTSASKTAAPKVFVAKTFAAQPSAANKAGAARTTAAKKAPAKPSVARPGARPAAAKTASARPVAASKPRAAAPARKSPAAKKSAPRKSPASRS